MLLINLSRNLVLLINYWLNWMLYYNLDFQLHNEKR